MDWANERYVKVYVRDSGDWLMWPWQTRALLVFLFRKVDRSGVLHLGKGKVRALAFIVGMPEEEVATALEPLLDDGCVQLRDDKLVIPNFMKAQETPQSDKLRKQASREKAREDVLGREDSPSVTNGHAPSQSVTLSLSEPSLAKPIDSAAAPVVERREKGRKGTRLPEGWTPSAGSYANVVKKTGQSQAEVLTALEEFCDFWRGVPGQKGCKLDWDATFRNRLREVWSKTRSKGFRSGRFPSSPPANGPANRDFAYAPGELEHARTKAQASQILSPALAALVNFGRGPPSEPMTQSQLRDKAQADQRRLAETTAEQERKAGGT